MTTSMAAFRGLMGASVTIGVDMARLPGYGPGSPRGSNSDVSVVDTGQHTQMSNGGEMRLVLRIDVQLAHVAAQIGYKCAAPPRVQRHANPLFPFPADHLPANQPRPPHSSS